MKGLVTESKDGYSAILREDGAFIRIKGTYETGVEIDLSEAQVDNVVPFVKRHFKTAVAAAAAALAVLLGFGGTKVYRDNAVSSYVTIDVKPSIEYSLNHDNLVLRAVALSDDAAPITEELNQKNIKGKTLENAIKQTIEIMKDKGYIEDGSEEILISVTSNDEKTAASLKETAETAAKANTGEGASVIAITASEEERQNASKEGKSAARVELENGVLKADAATVIDISPEGDDPDPQEGSAPESQSASASVTQEPSASGTSSKDEPKKDESEPTSEKPSAEPAQSGFAGGAVALTDPDSELDAADGTEPSDTGEPSDTEEPSDAKEPSDTGGPSDTEEPSESGGASSAETPIDIPALDPIEYEGTTEKPGDGDSEDPEGDIGFTGDPITIH